MKHKEGEAKGRRNKIGRGSKRKGSRRGSIRIRKGLQKKGR